MFSPSGPSSPCEQSSSPLRVGESQELGETQPPNFSIRDYVSKSRTEDIAKNWPFPQKFLKLCLKHGVKDVLPPFEPPDNVKNQCYYQAEEVEQLESCSRAENGSWQFDPVDDQTCTIKANTSLLSDELIVGCSGQAHSLLLEAQKSEIHVQDISDNATSSVGIVETLSVVTNHQSIERASEKSSEVIPCAARVSRRDQEGPFRGKVAKLHPLTRKLLSSHHQSGKKIRSIVKLRSSVEISRTEDISSPSSTVTDPMASKVCPVCKTFASTSNTTLNAHIDQCLSGDCTIERVVTKIQEPKVKPCKKRQMVDIYATAKHCTLEDLDKRNGTNWATELAFVARPSEPCNEVKRAKLSSDDTREEEKPAEVRQDGNGAVYVDSNGIKLRILSKFNDAPPSLPKKHFKLKKHKPMDNNDCFSKKKGFVSKYSKLNVKPKSMKLGSSESFKGEIQEPVEEDYDIDTDTEIEESPPETRNISGQIRGCEPASLRPWACSKRSDLPKKLHHKDISNSGKFMKIKQTDVGNSPVGKCHGRLSSQSKDLTCSPKIKRVVVLSDNAETKKCGKNQELAVFSPNWSSRSNPRIGPMPKSNRSMERPGCSPSRKQGVRKSTQPNTATRSTWSSHLQLENKKSFSVTTNALSGKSALEGRKGDRMTVSTSKKMRKCRSIPGTDCQEGGASNVSTRLRHSTTDDDLDAVRTNRIRRTFRPNLSVKSTKHALKEFMDTESPSSPNILESEDEEDAAENQKYEMLKWDHSEAECDQSDSAPSDMQVEPLSCMDTVTKSSREKSVANRAASKHITPSSNAKSSSWPSLDENVHSASESDSDAETSSGNTSNEKTVELYDTSSEDDDSQSIPLANKEKYGVGSTSAAQYMESGAGTRTFEEPIACLTSYATHDVPQEISSITSFRRPTRMAIDREHSRSSVSTATTVPPPSNRDLEFKNPTTSSLARPTVEDKTLTASVASLEGTEVRTIERRNREIEALHSTKEPSKSSDDQPCCCKRNGGLSGQSELLKQQRILPSEAKRLSHLYISPNATSATNSLTSTRADVSVIPVLESPTESVTTRASVDSTMKVMASTDFSSTSASPRTQTQSTSNSVFRLMGKDLMVVNKEESQMPIVYSTPETPSSAQSLAPRTFPINNWDCNSYHQLQFPGGSAVYSHAPSMVWHQIPLHPSNMYVDGSPCSWLPDSRAIHDQQIQQKYTVERTSAFHQPHREFVSSSQPNTMKEVIVIDDCPDYPDLRRGTLNPASVPACSPTPNNMQPRQFTYFPSEGQCFPRDANNGLALYSNMDPRGLANYTNNNMQASNLNHPGPLSQMPFAFQAPPMGRMRPPFFYSQTMR